MPRQRAEDFEATVDLANVKPDGQPVNVRVAVNAIDPRVTILDWQPRTIQVVLDQVTTKHVPVEVDQGTAPPGIDVGEMTFTPTTVSVTGPSTAVSQVVAAHVNVALSPEGIDFDRTVEPKPIDESGAVVTGVELDPRSVHVTIPLFTNRETRTLPVNPVVTGTPAQGFRISSVVTDPLVVSVEGDADQLSAADRGRHGAGVRLGRHARRRPERRRSPCRRASWRPPARGTSLVTVHIEAVTETRTYTAGIRLDGREPGLDYALSETQVLLTLFGPVSDLDRLGSAPIVVGDQRRGPRARHAQRSRWSHRCPRP